MEFVWSILYVTCEYCFTCIIHCEIQRRRRYTPRTNGSFVFRQRYHTKVPEKTNKMTPPPPFVSDKSFLYLF